MICSRILLMLTAAVLSMPRPQRTQCLNWARMPLSRDLLGMTNRCFRGGMRQCMITCTDKLRRVTRRSEASKPGGPCAGVLHDGQVSSSDALRRACSKRKHIPCRVSLRIIRILSRSTLLNLIGCSFDCTSILLSWPHCVSSKCLCANQRDTEKDFACFACDRVVPGAKSTTTVHASQEPDQFAFLYSSVNFLLMRQPKDKGQF
jgi:hypothetical protein